jgi:hypothetical protein
MKTELISFYADVDNKTYYSDHGRRLKQNCDELNIPSDIRQLESKQDYRLNCLNKPKFILDLLTEKKHPVLWMDVDSLIHKELNIFDELDDFDVAFAYQHRYPNQCSVNMPKASPIYFNYTDVMLDFLKYWITVADKTKETNTPIFDHELLMFAVIPEYYNKMKIYRLNREYAIWPGSKLNADETPRITMGIADGDSKRKGLENMGMSSDQININMNKK